MNKPILDVLGGKRLKPPPVWVMRQAGRYLPEYRAVREEAGDFLKLCLTPELAAEVTLQPVRRFGFDAAILFSDILLVPHALGQKVWFVDGEGPQLEPVANVEGVARLRGRFDPDALTPVYDAIHIVKEQLPSNVALLGFCGAPWTIATYMIAGHGTVDQSPARLFAYREKEAFASLIELLVESLTTHLIRQFEAGVDAVQIFDSWAGILPPDELSEWCIAPVQRLLVRLRSAVPGAKVIGFPRGIGAAIVHYADNVAIDALSLDWTADVLFARKHISQKIALQGNLDPLALVAGGPALDRAVEKILNTLAERPFIFNLGHGILPQTPLAHLEQMLRRVRNS